MSLEKWVAYGWLRREPTSPGKIKDLDAEALRSDIKTETNAPSLTGRALDDYATEDVRKLFGTWVKWWRRWRTWPITSTTP
jgi:hypothetical protein